ncbi:RNA-directed DNA polymerase [Psychrobacillus sp. INOP01]|uniref:reverse transcriptase family protein n=1 Tax=Psychrobacillus sp. INOP01 TaxID=2829187 RepID=UPI001BA497DE|nr:reverse transcriptase family protein [Psychrobacillus sp. INOP01]QUG43050.1 RNA-directed DNA polymerase [Psychrobacillus sp. INOP01]
MVNKKVRKINAIKTNSVLHNLQKKISNNFLDNIPLADCVCGFVKGKNYLDFLLPHCGSKFYLKVDIKDFFNSLKESLVRDTLSEYVDIKNREEKDRVLKELIYITTLNGSVPLGAITSPQLSNLLLRRIDLRIKKYCEKFNVIYTRYADDMLFSSNNQEVAKPFFLGRLKDILIDFELKINSKKTIIAENKIILNGYVISSRVTLTRNKMKKLNTLLYTFEYKSGVKRYPRTFNEFLQRLKTVNEELFDLSKSIPETRIQIINYLAGYRAFLLSFNKSSIKDYTCDFSKKIKRTEKMLDILSDIRY